MTTEVWQPRRNTAAGAAANNRIILQGERAFETDTGKWKTGDGSTHWNDLPYDDQDNGDGTVRHPGGVTSAAIINAGAALTTATALTLGMCNRYNASGGSLTLPALPALSTLRVGTRVSVEKDIADTSTYTITVTFAGTDALDSGATQVVCRIAGHRFDLQVVVVGGVKYWKVMGSREPLSSLDNRFTVAPVMTPSVATVLTDYQARPTRPAVVSIGDSITDINSAVTAWNGTSFSRTNTRLAYGYLNCAMIFNRQQANWWDVGISGQTAAQCLARFDTDVTPLNPHVVIEAAATNDIATNRTASDTFNDKLSMWRKAWKFGAKVIATTCPPRNTFTTTQAQEAHKLNAMLRNFAATNPQNFVLWDWYSVLADPVTGNYLSSPAATTDGVHPNSYGAWLLGKSLESALDRFLPPSTCNLAAANVNDLDNLLSNPLAAATGGVITSNKGLTGDAALGTFWTSSGTDSTLTAVLSRVARADGYGSWQQINTTLTPSSSATVTMQRTLRSEFAAGDVLQASIEFETDAAGWTNGVFDLQILLYDTTIGLYTSIAGAFTAGTDSIVLTRPEAGVLQTPPITVPPGTTTTATFQVSYGGQGTARFGRPAVRKIPTS